MCLLSWENKMEGTTTDTTISVTGAATVHEVVDSAKQGWGMGRERAGRRWAKALPQPATTVGGRWGTIGTEDGGQGLHSEKEKHSEALGNSGEV